MSTCSCTAGDPAHRSRPDRRSAPSPSGKHLFGGIQGDLGLGAPFRATSAFGSGLVIARYRTTCVRRGLGEGGHGGSSLHQRFWQGAQRWRGTHRHEGRGTLLIYLDSSVVVKLVHEEPESGDLESWLSGDEGPLVTSALTEIEVERALRRSDPDALPLVPEIIEGLYRFDIDVAVRRAAARFAEPTLCTLDAVHLATALEFGAELDAFVCYDRRLLAEIGRAHV